MLHTHTFYKHEHADAQTHTYKLHEHVFIDAGGNHRNAILATKKANKKQKEQKSLGTYKV